AISTPENFLNFVGLNEEANIEQSLNKNTYELMLCIHVIRGCVKRCKWPSDSDIAKKGNFVHPLSDSLKKIFYRNPAAQCIVPSLHQIFLLVRTLNALHDPAIQAKIHPSFLRALDISETDKYNILGTAYIDNLQRPKTIIERMNTFIHSAYDSCLHILGGAVENLSIDFYTVPSLSKLIMEGLFTNIQYMSDSRLRLLIRVFLRPFFLQCPALAYDEIMTVLSEFCPFMLKRLSTRWEKFRLRYGTSEEQFTEWQEILDDELQRILTREYISFLGDLLHSKYTSNNSVEDAMDDDSKEYSNVPMKTISELGQKIMTSENVRTVVICTAFDAMHWLDTSTNIKSVLLCELIFKKVNYLLSLHQWQN
ncbi:exportin-5-like, partial [Stegodyphus dumicola]|uniref:exportin-5-like n=1 Tax=Stegodyphus dumicola TaxID=202533 RepID=UPI0015AA8EFC